MASLALSCGAVTLVDDEDFRDVARFHWWGNEGYAETKVAGRRVLLHRLITGAPPGLVVDHINRNRLDNRRCNLRLATIAENAQNYGAHRDARSRFRGVSFHRQSGLWRARCMLDGREHSLGYFPTEEEAGAAAAAFRAKHMPYSTDQMELMTCV